MKISFEGSKAFICSLIMCISNNTFNYFSMCKNIRVDSGYGDQITFVFSNIAISIIVLMTVPLESIQFKDHLCIALEHMYM